MTKLDQSKVYIQYMRDVLTGKQVASAAVKQQCARMRDWFDRDDIYFNYDIVDRRLAFMEEQLILPDMWDPETLSRAHFKAHRFQAFMIAMIYGWYQVEKPNMRVIKKVYIQTSRKNGKSTLIAALCLTDAIFAKEDLNAPPCVGVIAGNGQQADHTLSICINFANLCDPDMNVFVTKKKYLFIRGERPSDPRGEILTLSSGSKTLDGYNFSTAIIDEYHQLKDDHAVEALLKSQKLRINPLAIFITTAGSSINGPCHEYYKLQKKKLAKDKPYPDTEIDFIYEPDSLEDIDSEQNWVKCMPILEQLPEMQQASVMVQMRQDYKDLSDPTKRTEALTKAFNWWCEPQNNWFTMDQLKPYFEKINLYDLRGQNCTGGLDLSLSNDLSAFALCFPPSTNREIHPDKYIFYVDAWVTPQESNSQQNKLFYTKMIANNYLHLTLGEYIDPVAVAAKIYDYQQDFNLKFICYDPNLAGTWKMKMDEYNTFSLVKMNQQKASFSEPVQDLQKLVSEGKAIFIYNPVTMWSLTNCVLDQDGTAVKPVKMGGKTSHNKIDPAIAILQALHVAKLKESELNAPTLEEREQIFMDLVGF